MVLLAIRTTCLALGLLALVALQPASAEPWVAPGDMRLRHDLELLYDSGVLTGPSLSWPLSWPDIARDLGKARISTLPDATAAALVRVRTRLNHEQRIREPSMASEVAIGAHPVLIRTFADTPREDVQASLVLDDLGTRFAYRLEATIVNSPVDGQNWRPDGSYVAASLGNWMLSFGWMDRWWGPGWDGSLILGTNARPIPAVAVERQESTPMDVAVLRWLGPWRFVTFMGQLEGNRDYSNALLFGMRIELRPLPSLQLAASRTAQWCGEGRSCTWSDFWNLFIGNDNNQPLDKQPGNQLAGFDLRWTWPGGAVPVAFYAQAIGEDEAGYMPSKYLGLFGLEAWGDAFGGSWRAHVEYADTACNFVGTPQWGCAYESSIYTDGYRYRGPSIGHSIDSDAESLGIGGMLVDPAGREWRLLLRDMRLNRKGEATGDFLADGPADVQDVELTHRLPFEWGTLEASVGYSNTDARPGVSVSVDEGWRGYISWRHRLR
ncbi:MAG: capsule assembly Wzi family protein [Gammaproteobacteria bacterium]|nr:capsule assembly Wzi family protein [Gammaproteobacteria bacterium]